MSNINKVCANVAQEFTDAEKSQARQNIDATRVATASSTSHGPSYSDVETLALWPSSNRLAFGATDTFVAPYTNDNADKGKVLKLNDSVIPEWTAEHYVSYDADQGLGAQYQKNARHNINAMTQSQLSEFVNVYTLNSLNGCYRCPTEPSWINVSTIKQYRTIVAINVPAHSTLFAYVNCQLYYANSAQSEWAMCIGTTQAINENTAKFFTNIPNIYNTNVPTIPFTYPNATDSTVTVYIGAYNHSGYPIDEAYLRGNIYNVGDHIYGPTITYEIRNLASIKSDT